MVERTFLQRISRPLNHEPPVSHSPEPPKWASTYTGHVQMSLSKPLFPPGGIFRDKGFHFHVALDRVLGQTGDWKGRYAEPVAASMQGAACVWSLEAPPFINGRWVLAESWS